MNRLNIALVALAIALSGCSSVGSNQSFVPATVPQAVPQDNALESVLDGRILNANGLGTGAIGKGVLVTNGDGHTPNIPPHPKSVAGLPIAHAHVGLAAWKPGSPVIWQDWTNAKGEFTVHAAPGKYLLVIEPPKAALKAGIYYPTIHDTVTLEAGTHELVAPTLPILKCAPSSLLERSGKYRMTQLTPLDVKFYLVINTLRVKRHWKPLELDEWLQEDSILFDRLSVYNHQCVYLSTSTVGYWDQASSSGPIPLVELAQGLAVHKLSWASSPKMIWVSSDIWHLYDARAQIIAGVWTMEDPRRPHINTLIPWP